MKSFTEYMNKSLAFRKVLTTYCVDAENEAQETRNHLKLLDCLDAKSNGDKYFRNSVLAWFNKKRSTLYLRDLCKEVGYDYWENLINSNIIDAFDSANIKDY